MLLAGLPGVYNNDTFVFVQDARVAVKCCEAVMLLAGLSEATSARAIVDHTRLAQTLTSQLGQLYGRLPKVMSPGDIEGVEAKWGYGGRCFLPNKPVRPCNCRK